MKFFIGNARQFFPMSGNMEIGIGEGMKIIYHHIEE